MIKSLNALLWLVMLGGVFSTILQRAVKKHSGSCDLLLIRGQRSGGLSLKIPEVTAKIFCAFYFLEYCRTTKLR